MFDPNELDAGVRDIVLKLRAFGFETTDSGDGTKAKWQEGAFPFPNIIVKSKRETLYSDADLLVKTLRTYDSRVWYVEASYVPEHDSYTLLATVPNDDVAQMYYDQIKLEEEVKRLKGILEPVAAAAKIALKKDGSWPWYLSDEDPKNEGYTVSLMGQDELAGDGHIYSHTVAECTAAVGKLLLAAAEVGNKL